VIWYPTAMNSNMWSSHGPGLTHTPACFGLATGGFSGEYGGSGESAANTRSVV